MSDRPLRIAVVSPAWFPVPPSGYGGIEWVVALLADGLVEAGHDVTLFASGDSRTKAKLSAVFETAPIEWIVALLADGLVEAGHDVTLFASGDSRTKAKLSAVFETAPSAWIGRSHFELLHSLPAYLRAEEFDAISEHTGMIGIVLSALVETPVVHTVHGPLTGDAGEMYETLAKLVPNLHLISISLNQRRPRPDLPWIANCPNALDLSVYPCKPHKGDYLLFLGRMSPDKGCHRAIAVAMELELPLKIAGKRQEAKEERYFAEFVEPHLGIRGIEYLGEVSHGTKVELLQDARATLFPIDWEEPFGLVMIESMACGTPVIATNRGAVPEVIEHGRSGIIVDDYRQIPVALEAADALDPLECRRYVEERFSPERMVDDYVRVYRDAMVRAAEPVSASLSQ